MTNQQKFALTPIAGAVATALSPVHQVLAQDSDSDIGLEEIVVTATKRSRSIQEIPASVQAITQESLAAMGARNMEDFSRFIPSVNVVSYGTGSDTVVFRGAITGSGYIAQSTSSVYLDEISLTTTGSQPSVRMVDIERVEALSGPQGTLYGSDSQAGTMRIITNKPNLNEFEAIINAEFRGGENSDSSYRGSLVFNIPLIEDRMAARISAYSDRDGGYIDNVFGHTPNASALNVDFPARPGGGNVLPADFGSFDNSASVEENWNDSETMGARLHLLWDFGDKWSANLTAMTQKTESGADNDYDPYVGDLQTVRFHTEWAEDNFDMYSLTLNGDLGFAQLVASANYLDRTFDSFSDITIYGHYWQARYCHDSYYTTSDTNTDIASPYFGDYLYPYYWENPETGYITFYPVYCMGETVSADSFQSYLSPYQQDKTTVEIRLSSQGDTLDWIVGYYNEESNDSWQAPFATPTTGGNGSVNTYQDSASLNYMEFYFTNWVYYDPLLAPDNLYYTYPEATSWWYSDSHTIWAQDAVFGEMTWHMNDSWDLTVGGRYFERSNTNFYRVDHPGDIGLNGEPDTAAPDKREYRLANNNQAPERRSDESEFIPKVALRWTLSDEHMVYGLFTQGTRPGGVNRSRGEPFFPKEYASDLMDNYEMGYRSSFGDGRGRFNATFYHMVWTDYQLQLTDPASDSCPDTDDQIANVCGQPWQSIITNAGEAHITGINFELDYAFNDSWVFGGNALFMEAETDTTADLTGDGEDDLVAGLRLPMSPQFKASAWLDWNAPTQMLGASDMFWRLQASYTGDSMNRLEPHGLDAPNPQLTNEAYALADMRFGIRGDDWEASIFMNNLTDERATYTYGTDQMNWAFSNTVDGRDHFQKKFTNRPREIGVRFMKRWGD
jgi:iron complex outermembrane receptor protein